MCKVSWFPEGFDLVSLQITFFFKRFVMFIRLISLSIISWTSRDNFCGGGAMKGGTLCLSASLKYVANLILI